MTYQQARRIRNKDYSLANLITRNIRSRDMGAGESIKAALREKFDVRTRLGAKVKGIKEKFDILNIAKFLTGGSNVAPALLGKMLGRSKADIRNFTGGRQSYEDFGSPTATRIGRDPNSGGDMTGMSEILGKILELQQRTYDNIKEQRETKNNFQEEREMEAKKRHDDLLNAIRGFKPEEKPTTEKVANSGGLNVADTIQSMLSAFGGISQMVKIIGGLVASPIGIALLAGAGLAAAIYELWKISSPETVKQSLEGEGAGGVTAAGLGAEGQITAPTASEEVTKKLAASFDKKGLKGASIEELQAKKAELLSSGTDPRIKQKNGMKLDDVDTKKLKLINDIDNEIASRQKSTPVSNTPASPTTSTTSNAEPASTTPPSQQLNAVTSENRTAKMDSMVTPTSSTTVNNMQATNTVKPKTPKDDIPPVRNLERTFQRMIFNSTRVV